jgi:hypothetical protein
VWERLLRRRMMVTSEREMVRKNVEPAAEQEKPFTSLQSTYEDTVPDEDELDWDDEGIS